jgi:SAM-dependent methyltransferase
LYLSQLPSPEFLAELYQNHEALDEGASSRADEQAARGRRTGWSRLVRPHLWPLGDGHGRRILDIGCSSGRHLRDFRDRGWQVSGIDLDASAIAKAQQAMPDGEFEVGDPTEADLGMAKFDIVRLDNTLEHVPDPRRLLTKIRPALKPGGRLLVYVPHGRAASIAIFGKYSINVWPPFHLQLFSRDGLRALLVASGFNPVSCWGYTPRGILASSASHWMHREARGGAARRPSALACVVELALWPLLVATRSQEELIGIGCG